jgi:hypothetical protein
MAGITINPSLVTNAPNTFYSTSTGGVQGTLADNPVSLTGYLRSGIVATNATTPMWGGEGVTISLPTSGTEALEIAAVLTLASAETNLLGFTVFNQASAMIQSPQSPVPLAAAGMGINFFEMGSGARIWVQATSGVAGALLGGAINQAVYWDYTNQVLLGSPGGTALPVKVVDVNVGNSQVVTYSSGTGFVTWNRSGSAVLIEI